jgi:quinol monooxygenase YgiN
VKGWCYSAFINYQIKLFIMKNNSLEIIATMTVRKGKLEGFKQQAMEIIRLAREKDTKTLRYDWFLSSDETHCEVHELYESSEGLIEHRVHIDEALNRLFREFADDHAVSLYGEPSSQLKEMIKAHTEVHAQYYTGFGGLTTSVKTVDARVMA